MTKEPKWTKGPWKAEIRCVHPDMGGNHQMDYRVRIPCATVGARVSMCMMGGGRQKDTKEVKANAHLIAAAPELYEWLEFILRDEAMVHYFSLTYPEAFKGAKAALSKALGEKT